MSVSSFVKSAVRKILTLSFVGLLVTRVGPKRDTAKPIASTPPPLTPMPQAPGRSTMPPSVSDQDYAKPQSPFPNVIAPYRSQSVHLRT